MYIVHGTSRVVTCFPRYGFVLKFPKPKPLAFLKHSFRALHFAWKTKNTKLLVYHFSPKKGHATEGSMQQTLLNGIWHNWQEARLYRATKSPFLEPTICSLLGLCNLQRYRPICTIADEEFTQKLLELSENKTWGNSHHFANPKNFTLSDGVLRMCDYGDHGLGEVVVSYGETLSKAFTTGNNPEAA